MQRGLAHLALVAVIAVAIFGVAIGILVYRNNLSLSGGQKACTQEAKICPGGTSVGRTGPNCEFAACPIVKPSATASANPASGGTSWKTYTNTVQRYSIQYPSDLLIVSTEACKKFADTDLHLFKINNQYLCGSNEPNYFSIDLNNQRVNYSADTCFSVTKQLIKVGNVPAEEIIATFKTNDKSCIDRGVSPVSDKITEIYFTNQGKNYHIYYPILDIKENILTQILSTFKFN